MPVFASSDKFIEVLGGFFGEVAGRPEIAGKLLASGLVIRFIYSEPEAVIVVDCSGSEIDVRCGDREAEAEVEMTMAADVAHRFWFGKVNLTRALTRREIIARGPIPKILKLLPAIKPTYALYPQYLEANGYNEYLLT